MDMDPLLAELEKRLRDTLARPDGTAPPAFLAGDVVAARFRIARLLGAGGMGEVYEADDLVLGERVALKTLPQTKASEERAVERLKREIALARRVTHANVCRVFDAYEHQPVSGPPIVFFTMERLDGETLRARLERLGNMLRAGALPLIRQMAAALDAAHAAGVVHGDFKPGNVMIAPAPSGDSGTGGERVVVTDFGLARPAVGSTVGTMTLGWGTPAYMAPEQVARGQITPQTDVYSLGLVVEQMVEAGAGTPWRAAIDKCLERDPAARFQTPGDFVRALEAPDRRARRRRAWTAAGLIGGAAVGLVAWLLAMRTGRPAPASETPAPSRTVAVLPFETSDRTPDGTAFNRGLAVVLTEQLHLASVVDAPSPIRALPTEEVIEGVLRSPETARRTLGADLVVTGRVDREGQSDAMDVSLKVGDRSRAVRVLAGRRLLLPSAMAELTAVLDLKLSAATMKRAAEGGTSSPAAEADYLRGRGYLLQAANVDAAIHALQRARQADNAFALAVAALSDAYRQKYADARDPAFITLAQNTVDEAIKLNPGVAYTHVVRGSIYVDTSQHERAIREFQAALAADPATADARRRLAEVYEAQGSLRQAEESYQQEIALYPHYWRPLVDFASFLIRHGRYADAESNLLTASQSAPDNVRVIGNLAGLYALTERFAAAEAELRRGLDAGPNAMGLNNLAWVFIYEGQMDKAVPMLEEAVKAPHADSTHWANLARVYRWTNHPAQARATYDAAIRLARSEISVNPRDARIRSNLASLLAETGHRADALAEMTATLERAPTDVSALFRSAIVHELTGDRNGALTALEAAARGGYSAVEIRQYPDLARLRTDPRFLDILTLAHKPPLQ